MANVEAMKGTLRTDYGVGLFEDDNAIAIRIPKESILDIDEDDIKEVFKKRDIIVEYLKKKIEIVYLIAEESYVSLDPEKFTDYILSEIPEVSIEWGADGVKISEFDMGVDGAAMGIFGLGGGGGGPGGGGGGGGGVGPGYGGGEGEGKATTSKIVIKGVGSIDSSKIKNILGTLSKTSRRIVSGYIKSGRRTSVITTGKRGRYVRYKLPSGDAKNIDIALVPTIRAAAQKGRKDTEGRLRITTSDMREKVRRRKISTMICMIYDTSGSMAQEERLEVAKQVTNALLLDAYQKRDRIALITYGGEEGKIAMPFTSSVEAAKKYLENVVFGGTTPLASGLLKGFQLLRMEMNRDSNSTPLMIIFTDGTANKPISFGADVRLELMRVCNLIKGAKIRSLIIDVSPSGAPLAMRIAESLDAKYYNPHGLHKERIYEIISNEREQIKLGRKSINPQQFISRMMT